MNVANIMPGDDVKVELRYTELLLPTDGNYQFVFPTVSGPALQQRAEQPGQRHLGGPAHHAGGSGGYRPPAP